MSIYDFPDVYDAVQRAPTDQIELEVNSILKLLEERGITKGRVLELACGTSAHGILLARHGFSVAGLDTSQKMLEGAEKRARSSGVEIELHQGNVINFNLETEPFDCVIFMAETFPLITKYSDIERHFQTVRRHLRKDGIYIVDIDSHKHGVGTKHEIWGRKKVNLENGFVEVWCEDFPGDWVNGTGHMKLHCRIHVDGTISELMDDYVWRVDSPWNIEVLIKTLENWSLVGFFSWRNLSRDIVGEEHFFMVLE